MHHIQLDDQLYQETQRKATEAGFLSVDDYVANILQQNLSDEFENLDRFFTPARLAHIDHSVAQIDAGEGLTPEQADEELNRRRADWLRKNQK